MKVLLEQRNIYGLLVSVLYEASFFGFKQERLEKELQELDEAIKECTAGTAKTDTMEEVREHLGLEKEENDADTGAEQLKKQVIKAAIKYDNYCKERELQKLMELLRENME